ncbi:MAG: acylphosphatase [Thiohalomonadales bacterium]
MQCTKCIISGRVQGVYYRGSARKQAQALGLTGFAKNLADGCVEVLICGDPEARESLQNWLAMGPQYAEVTAVQCETVELDAHQIPGSFTTA